jgi:hypothetical protein
MCGYTCTLFAANRLKLSYATTTAIIIIIIIIKLKISQRNPAGR